MKRVYEDSQERRAAAVPAMIRSSTAHRVPRVGLRRISFVRLSKKRPGRNSSVLWTAPPSPRPATPRPTRRPAPPRNNLPRPARGMSGFWIRQVEEGVNGAGPHDHLSSPPYRLESNGIIERRVGIPGDSIRCLLNQSGLPHGWWPYAGRAFPHGLNIRKNSNGMSPWYRKHGQPWSGPDHAFGMQVHFRKPQRFHDGEKFAARGSTGIFVGWFLLPGGIYKGNMLIIDVAELAEAPPDTKPRVYRVKEGRVLEIGMVSPLRVAHLEARQGMLADPEARLPVCMCACVFFSRSSLYSQMLLWLVWSWAVTGTLPRRMPHGE